MFGIATNALPRACGAFDDWIDCFEMARVSGEPDLHFRARAELADGAITEMIFYVAITSNEIGNVVLGELSENDGERFAQKIREHVQPAAMRHAHANFLDASATTFVQDGVENDHERFGTLQ